MTENFDEFVRGQFPFRPDHPDYQRLREVVAQYEEWKAKGVPAEEAYEGLMDTYSVVYMAANRAGMNPPRSVTPKGIVELTTNAWTEGFLFGLLFQKLGGHREE